MINEESKAPRSAYPRSLILSFAALLLLASTYCVYLFVRVDAVTRTNNRRAPSVGRLFDLRSRTNDAVQECFAFVISGDEAEKRDFETWAANYEQFSRSFLQQAALDAVSREQFDRVLEQQHQIAGSGRQMITTYAQTGVVDRADFDAFEHDVDQFSRAMAVLQRQLESEWATSQQNTALVWHQTRTESLVLGAVFAVLSATLLFLLLRRFHAYDQLREKAMTSIMESNRRFRLIFESEPQCVKLVDREGRLVDINSAGLQLLEAEREDVLGKCIFDVIVEEDRERFIKASQAVLRGESNRLEFEIVGLKGQHRTMTTRQVPIRYGSDETAHVLSITEDITEKRRIEQQLKDHRDKLAHASRVNLLGELVSSIAHELNQPLSAATNYAFVLEKLASESPVQTAAIREHAGRVRDQAHRAAEIVRGIRRLLKPNPADNQPTDIHQLIESSLGIMGPDLRARGVDLITQLHAESLTVDGHQVQLQQVLMNLFQNAIQAMDQVERSRRTLTIHTVSTTEHIEIRVKDTGNGIESEDKRDVFRTFFTTKPEGMGMGLAVARSIIEAHQGSLVVEESTPRGTVFLVVLPLSGEFADECCESKSMHC
ncbi:Sensor protein FixL [Stieleria neptunia]|uniref:histidine kinase n=1 Tax=Stieleria neptunia TaxID=2527979 RepID=A0A518HNF6_9BACT|nr:ATP-binding protein [Stieleria neptunia]QDV42378.1 Sensor protein FixL [Stieleria neptunia]